MAFGAVAIRKVQNISGFTPQQIEAIQCELGPTLVVAGAGSGKTLVLAKRFEYLVKERGINPKKILVVTFSKKAAANMKKRIFKFVELDKESEKKCYICTFHRFAMEFLKAEKKMAEGPGSIGFTKKDRGIWRDCIDEARSTITARDFSWKIMKKIRWITKKEFRNFRDITYEEFVKIGRRITNYGEEKLLEKFPMEEIARVHDVYDKKLKERGIYPFDDLILDTNILLSKPGTKKKWNNKFDAILCDEFQDIDDVQFEIIKKLSESNNVLCVGDPDQAIYGFRGAVPNIFSKFKEFFNQKGIHVEEKKLEKNFRSTPEILRVTNKLINNNRLDPSFSKELFTDNDNGDSVSLHITRDIDKEEERIIEKIVFLNEEKGVPLKEMAVLARNFKHSQSIMNKLLARRIPYDNPRVINNMLSKMEIKDLICWFNIAFARDEVLVSRSVRRVINKPSRGIGPRKIEDLYRWGPKTAFTNIKKTTVPQVYGFYQLCERLRNITRDTSKGLTVTEKLNLVLEESGYFQYYGSHPGRLESARAFIKATVNDWDSVSTIQERMAKFTPKSIWGDELMVSTIHGVKGLEFSYVFLMKLGEGQLPSKIGIKNASSELEMREYIEEEKRLAYVAMTRAKKALFLSTSSGWDDRSRFVKEVESLLNPIDRDESLDGSYAQIIETEEDILSWEELENEAFEKASIDIEEEDEEDSENY